MLNLRNLLLAGLALAASASFVQDLTPDNFDSVVLNSGKPSLVEFFAPWCGHCKTLAPTYEELATSLSGSADKVNIAKVDADAHKSLGVRFGIKGFPTIKYFDGKSETPIDYTSARDLASLQKFVKEQSGAKAKAPKTAATAVEMLTDTSFRKVVGSDKDVFVAFTAPWCGHCKTLAPAWESLAEDFANEPTVVVAKVDAEADNSKSVTKDQGVTGYPTIKFFPKGSTTAQDYNGGRTEAALLAFLNEKTGSHRIVGGGLDTTAGTIAALDAILAKAGGQFSTVSEEFTKAAGGLSDKYAEYYNKVAAKMGSSNEYATKELSRLEGILKKGGLARSKEDDLISRSNVLRRFIGQSAEDVVNAAKDAGASVASAAGKASDSAASAAGKATDSAASVASVASASAASAAGKATDSVASAASAASASAASVVESVKGEL